MDEVLEIRWARTTQGSLGIAYEVLRGEDELLWARFVPFGQSKRYRAGGPAFVEAAREQERVAREGL